MNLGKNTLSNWIENWSQLVWLGIPPEFQSTWLKSLEKDLRNHLQNSRSRNRMKLSCHDCITAIVSEHSVAEKVERNKHIDYHYSFPPLVMIQMQWVWFKKVVPLSHKCKQQSTVSINNRIQSLNTWLYMR